MVEVARTTSSIQALHGWIQRSVREPAASLLRSLGVGVSLDKILSSFKLAYGTVLSFDELMGKFLNVEQSVTESVTDYVVRLEKVFALLKENYPDEFAMVDNAQHLRERIYRGLRPEIHQRLTPSYEDKKTPYEVLLRRARQLEEEYSLRRVVEAKGARDDPQMRNVIQTLKEIREQIEQRENLPPHPKKKWKGKYGCYHCGESDHWRKTCPQRPQGRKRPLKTKRRSTPPDTSDEESPPSEEVKPTPATKKNAKKEKLAPRPQYYNPDPIARMFGRANEATVEVNGVSTTCLVDTGATVTIVNAEFCDQLGLEVYSLNGLVTVLATGGTNIPYLGYTVATIEFPHIPKYSEEVVMLVINDSSEYASRVPLQIGTRVIAAVAETLTPEDIKHLDETWKQTYVATLMSCAVNQKNREDGDTFDLDTVKGPVKLKKEVELEPLEQKEVWGYTQVKGHSKRVVVCTDSGELKIDERTSDVCKLQI